MFTLEFEWLIRLIVSILFGSLIGYERYSHAKEAGVRTHAIVCLASCLLMIISQNAFPDDVRYDAARIAAQVVSGVGFLGAGIIYVQKGTIQGLTTAAGIWATSAVGLSFGAGMYALGISGSVLIFLVEFIFPYIFTFSPPRNIMTIRIYLKKDGHIATVNNTLSSLKYNRGENLITSDGEHWIITTEINSHRDIDPQALIKTLEKEADIDKVEITA